MFSTFFFYCSGDHRDLHSFPTRRSSDLLSVTCMTASTCECLLSVTLAETPITGSRSLRNSLPTRIARCTTIDRKSTRLNSSHMSISYAVFCLKKKKIHLPHYESQPIDST